MDQILLSQLHQQTKRLEEIITSGRELTQGDTIPIENVIQAKIALVLYIDITLKTIDKYLTTSAAPSEEETSSSLSLITQGRELQIALETLLQTSAKVQDLKSTTKLPNLSLPKFSGNVLEFSQFWDRFQASVGTRGLEDVDKLTYLMGCLEGEALEAVQGIEITNAGYNIAVTTIHARFGDKNIVIDGHHKALSQLSKCSYSAKDCRRNIDSIEKHLRVLDSLGEDIESNHLRSLLTDKFPDQVLYEVNLITSQNKSVASMREALQKVIRAMELSRTERNPHATEQGHPQSSTEALHLRTVRAKRGKFSSKTTNRSTASYIIKDNRKRKGAGESHKVESKKFKRACIFCAGDHFNDECTRFKTVTERKQKIQDRCYNCFMKGHRVANCKRPRRCFYCKGSHNRALCPKKPQGGIDSLSTSLRTLSLIKHNVNGLTFLQTATVRIVSQSQKKFRLLLDSGSQRSYITQKLAKELNLIPHREDLLMIYTFGDDKPKETMSPAVNIKIETNRGIKRDICVNVVPFITDRLVVPQLGQVDLIDVQADDGSAGTGVDILVGNDYYFSFIRPGRINIDENLFLINSDFGWIVTGYKEIDYRTEENVLSIATYHQSNRQCACYTEPDLPLKNPDIKFLWSLENIGITDPVKITREEEAIQNFNDTVLYQGGRYYVKWPWTEYPPNLPTNYGLAYGRLKGLLLRLDLPTLQEYDKILQEQLDGNIIEYVEAGNNLTSQATPPLHYLPHHIVKQQGKRGRIVYDASAKVRDELSLNECMFRGPCMLQDLTALLLNFRLNQIGITADVEKAFLQVGLQPEDREVTRFLWVRDITKPISNNNIVHMRFCRVPFGIIASPFLLTAVIRHHITKTNSSLLDHIANKCYVDNLVAGTNTTNEAKVLYRATKEVFKELSMNIRDWTSNNKSFIEEIPEVDRAKQAEEVKVLGLLWEKGRDILRLNIQDETLTLEKEYSQTKRDVLRMLASIYDPCGIASPLLLPAKIFLQKLWIQDYDWDTKLSDNLKREWSMIVDNLKGVKQIEMPRCVCLHGNKRNTEYELHCFSDASKHAYAAVVYLRADDGNTVKTSILMSKSRIVPLDKERKAKKTKVIASKAHPVTVNKKKPLTIPQLELLGYVIGNRLLVYLKKTIELEITNQYIWTDSLVVLSWVKSKRLLTPWVTNRINEIKKNIGVETRYVNTRLNPADIATRPEHGTCNLDTMWFQGPDFLMKNRRMWPKEVHPEHQEPALSVVAEGLEEPVPDQPLNKPSEAQSPNQSLGDNTNIERRNTGSDQMKSSNQEIRELQCKFFPEEVKGIETHLTRNLGLFMDVDGLLRCKGRMMHAELPYDTKHPIILPKDCEYTTNLIREIHERNYHVGVTHTLTIIRQRFWIPQGRSQVQKVLRRCPQCVKQGGGPYKLPPTPALPPERVRYEAPFAYTGIDYFGPMFVRTESGKEKRWVCLLTCLVVRSIHLEIVNDLTAEECLLALRRFLATRGIPKLVLSDNALQFKLVADVMTSPYCIQNKIKWKFTPELAPWHGGVYERLVGVVKSCLKRTLWKHLLNDSQLATVLKEVESVVNTRPLTCVSSNTDYVLKPADFLSFGKCLTVDCADDTLPLEGTSTKQSLIAGWKRGLALLQEFKDMFVSQYLTSLRERYKHSQKQPRVKSDKLPEVGDLVQIKGENKNRLNWRVGRISELVRGLDGECRVARVKVGDTEFTRSIGHLYPLEADITGEDDIRIRPVLNVPETPLVGEEINKSGNQEKSHEIDQTTEADKDDSQPRGDELREERAKEGTVDEVPVPELVSEENEIEDESTMEVDESGEPDGRVKRAAAIRARGKIAEWTRQLIALLK